MIPTRDKPDFCYTSGCPLATKGTRFVLGCGDPKTAKLAIMLEGPGHNELEFILKPEEKRRFYATKEECDKEIAIRKRDYPDIPIQYLLRGAPIVGKSGFEMSQWCLPAAGINRGNVFIDNSLRCLSPKHGDSCYPQGNTRKLAESKCRHYDRWHIFNPEVAVVSIHPAAIVREPTPLWLQIKNFEKARDFVKSGLRVLVLAGGKATKWWLGYGENTTRWQGHYEFQDAAAVARRVKRLEEYASVNVEDTHAQKDDPRNGETSGDKRGRRVNAVEALLGE